MAESAMVPQKEQRIDVSKPEDLRRATTYTPRVDIFENEDELTLFADLPGVKAEDVDIRFENHELEIFGKCCPRQESSNYLQWEYGVGDFHRSFRINQQIEADKISAELKHGVLTVHVPKSESVKPKRITVKGD